MSASAATAVKHKILLLDDDPVVLDIYQQMLLQLPSEPEVHIATSGQSAMAMLDAEPFNLLVSDLNMPRMDGLSLLEKLQEALSATGAPAPHPAPVHGRPVGARVQRQDLHLPLARLRLRHPER